MKVAEAQAKVQTQLGEPMKIREGLKKVMGWHHLYLPWLFMNIILHKL
jgi:hypothetical protein